MFNFGDYFSQIASRYLQRYQNLLAESTPQATMSPVPNLSPSEKAADVAQPATVIARPEDSSLIGETPMSESPAPVTGDASDSYAEAPVSNSGDQDSETESLAPSTYDDRLSQLRYGLSLGFNLSAIERTVSQLSSISDGEVTQTTEMFERLSSANFGLHTDLRVSGLEVDANGELPENSPEKANNSRGAASYLTHNGLFNGRGIQRAATALKGRLNPANRTGYQLAVNRFSLRFKNDVNFSFSNFTRFQSQVSSLNEVSPEALDGYNARAGELAEFSSNGVMDAFFNTVDAHLEQNEEALMAKIEEFFDVAAQELNLSEKSVEAAKESLSATVESFFERVGAAVDSLESRFTGAENVEEVKDVETPAQITSQPALDVSIGATLNAPQVDSLDDVVGVVNPEQDYLEALLHTLEDSAERLDAQLDAQRDNAASEKEENTSYRD